MSHRDFTRSVEFLSQHYASIQHNLQRPTIETWTHRTYYTQLL